MNTARKRQLERLQGSLPKGALRMDEQTLAGHSGDKWFASHPPEAVAFPEARRRFRRFFNSPTNTKFR